MNSLISKISYLLLLTGTLAAIIGVFKENKSMLYFGLAAFMAALPLFLTSIFFILRARRKKEGTKNRLEVLQELQKERLRITTEITVLEDELEPEKKPAYRSIRGGS